MRHINPTLVGRTIYFQRDEIILLFSYHFANMNLLIAFHTILQNEESLGRLEEVEDVGQEEDLEVERLEESLDGGQEHSKEEEDDEEEGHEEGEGLDDEGVLVMGLHQDLHPHAG
jgi:hypothetical protein